MLGQPLFVRDEPDRRRRIWATAAPTAEAGLASGRPAGSTATAIPPRPIRAPRPRDDTRLTTALQRALRVPSMEVLSYAEARRRFEHDYLVSLLKLTDGNVADAARLAERNRTEFYRLLQKHGLTPGRFRGDGDTTEELVAG